MHLHVARLSAVEGPGSKEAQSLIDDFLAARRLAEPVEKATLADPAGRRVLFWNSYEGGFYEVALADQQMAYTDWLILPNRLYTILRRLVKSRD